ncbi:MAG: DUF1566 domain-containing protein, partial [Alphaproteobacteria bacterium]|nr:DUF1566 domain-containing protein [Alphaproteobacteria bacterium]
ACPEHGVCTSKTCGGTTKYTLNSCEGGESTQLTCNVGDIYYSDDTCSPDVISGKTPIGVVYDTEHKLVISLNEKRGSWGNVTENDDTELENFTNVTAAKTDLNGKSNTDILVLLRNHPAANYCHNMTTGSKTWYLPAFGEMQLMSNSAVNSKLGTVGTSFASSSYYWSSTEHHYPSAWYFNPVNGDSSASGKGLAHSLRCVFSYADPKTYVKDGNVCIKQEQCSLDDYPLNSCPEHGTCSSKTCDGTTKYKLNSCESGYKVNDGMCELNDVLCICPSAGDVDYQCRFPSVVGVWGTLSQTSDSCGNESVCTICYWDGKYVREIITLKHGADGVRCETGAVGNTDKPVIVISGSGWYELVDSTNAPVGSEPKGEYNMSKYSLIYTNSSTTLAKSYLELTGTYDSIKNQLINDNTYYLAFKTEAECESAIDQYFPDGETVVVDVMEVPEYN